MVVPPLRRVADSALCSCVLRLAQWPDGLVNALTQASTGLRTAAKPVTSTPSRPGALSPSFGGRAELSRVIDASGDGVPHGTATFTIPARYVRMVAPCQPWRRRLDDLEVRHHPGVFMLQLVAVHHKKATVGVEADEHLDGLLVL